MITNPLEIDGNSYNRPMSSVKILFAGDVMGNIDALFKRVEAVNSSNGPFDALICVGQFLEQNGMWHFLFSVRIVRFIAVPTCQAQVVAIARANSFHTYQERNKLQCQRILPAHMAMAVNKPC